MKKYFILLFFIFFGLIVTSSVFAASEYGYPQKKEYIENTKAELKKVRQDLADMEENAKRAKGEAKVEVDKKIKNIKVSIDHLQDRLEIVKNSSAEKWEQVKNEFNESVSGVKDMITESRQWLSKKIAP